MFAGVEVVDVSPVGHYESVPVEVFLHPAGEKLLVGVEGESVVAGRVDHQGEGTGLQAGLEWCEMLLAEL